MPKCVNCQKRKGKRECPALKELLCQLCCGLLREKEINCPPDCPHLQQHKVYQKRRTSLKNSSNSIPLEEDIFQDEKLVWLVYNIEKTILTFSKNNQAIEDRDIHRALQYVQEEMDGKGSIILSDQPIKPIPPLGKEILQVINNCRYEKKIILPDSYQTYRKEDKVKVISYILATVKLFGGGKHYLRQMEQRIAGAEQIIQNQKLSF
ncbi:MAG: hypothetical protein ACOC57_04380 [Acidobacteriota bacterium]